MSARKVASLLGLLEQVGAVMSGAKGELRLPPYAPEPSEAARLAVAEAERHQLLQRSRTDMMRQFAEAAGCRVAPLLAYFGEQMAQRCGHCDNCARDSAGGRTDDRSPARALLGGQSSLPGSARTTERLGSPYPLHSLVQHRDWGRGTVLGYDDDRMTVLFDQVGYKTLSVAVIHENNVLAAL